VTTRNEDTQRQRDLARARGFLMTNFGVRHLLVATVLCLLAFAILMLFFR
jgi:hypothetical protein